MLKIESYDDNHNYRTLDISPQIFHDALRYVLRGETRFHVRNDGGQDFDLVYVENDKKAKADATFPDSQFYRDELIFPPYYFYDEDDPDKINLELLDGFDEIFFEETNEYTIAIAMLALKQTNLSVSFMDVRAMLFPWLASRIVIGKRPASENAIYVQTSYYPFFTKRDRFCALGLFHSLFMLQWLTDLPKERIKYLELSIRKTEGIGSILSTYSKARQAFQGKGIQVFLEPGCTRYRPSMLRKYFSIEEEPEDMDETNTAYVKCFNAFALTPLVDRHDALFDLNALSPHFVQDLQEYADAVFGNRKMLGVLLRGTDIVVANFAGSYRPADIEDCIRIIGKRMKQYSYDKIFLATEDSDYLACMKDAFPKKVIVVSQKRHSVEDFRQVKYLSDMEKQSGSDYQNILEDNLVNYMYAMYLLSRCESLIANCMCNGVNIAVSFNEGKYARKEIVSDMPNRGKETQ